jgi:hypothetical protein
MDYSLITMIKYMSQETDGKSPKEINSYISLIIWVLQILPPYKETRPRYLGRTRKEVENVYA